MSEANMLKHFLIISFSILSGCFHFPANPEIEDCSEEPEPAGGAPADEPDLCESHDDCRSTHFCHSEGICEPRLTFDHECRDDRWCSKGLECEPMTDRCVDEKKECENLSDCPHGQFCLTELEGVEVYQCRPFAPIGNLCVDNEWCGYTQGSPGETWPRCVIEPAATLEEAMMNRYGMCQIVVLCNKDEQCPNDQECYLEPPVGLSGYCASQ